MITRVEVGVGKRDLLTSYQLSVVQMTLKGCPSFTRISLGVTFDTRKALTAPASSRDRIIIFILIGERRRLCGELSVTMPVVRKVQM